MGIEFKMTDRELPVSPAFVHFLASTLAGEPQSAEIWADQISEVLVRDGPDRRQAAADAAALIMGSATGRELLARAYGLLFALLIGDLTHLRELQSRFRFVTVIGIPRTGGSYLTAELFRALGMVPQHVPHALAHDSFPIVGPFELQPGANSWICALKTVAEYLTMVEVFFGERDRHDAKIVVPKKLTQAGYAGGLFHRILGDEAEHILTLRHPAAACVSTYEKSGGMPAGGAFAVRSNIEEWCRRDLQYGGLSEQSLKTMNYFDAYLRYWEHYHSALATTGLFASRNLRLVVFGPSALCAAAQEFHARCGSGLQASDFRVSDRARSLHPEWVERAQPSIDRVAAVWDMAGLRFPIHEINACW